MEEQNQNSSEVIEVNQSITLSENDLKVLNEAAKWANFLAILGFISVGFLVILSFFAGAVFSFFPMGHQAPIPAVMGPIFTILYLAFAALYFFPVYYLYGFASKTKKAIHTSDSEALNKAFNFLKSHYKFVGILTIIMMSTYFLGGLFAAIGFMIAKF